MDSITHIFLGATIGQIVSDKKNSHKAALVGALASTAPDFDVFIHSSSNPLLSLEMHRSFTHSLLFIPIGALIVLGLVLLFFKSMRQDWKVFLLVCLLAYGSHGLLDSCTSYGTQLFWPFRHTRVSWDIISIINPAFTLCLIIGSIVSWYESSKKPALIGLLCASIFLIFCYFQHDRAMHAEKAFINHQGQSPTALRVMPTLANVYSYEGLYFSNERLYYNMVKVPLFGDAYVVPQGSVPIFHLNDLPPDLEKEPKLLQAAQIFSWFAQGYVSVASEKPFILVDMRYLEKSPNLIGLWGVGLSNRAGQPQVKRLDRVTIGV